MLMTLAIALVISGPQDPAASGTPPSAQPRTAYSPPPIRPFEPSSTFGREAAQGAEGAEVWRRPIVAPVVVDAYVGHYEATPTDIELAYDQGVASAEIRMDQRMGPLDGRWRVTGDDGRVVYDLILADAADDTDPVEGGWRSASGETGVAAAVDAATIVLDGAGTLRLTSGPTGFTAILSQGGRERPARLVRP